MQHIDIKSKVASLKLKVGIRFNLIDIEKYITEENDEEEQKQRLVDLIKKYNFKINQDIIDLFKDKVWFKEIFFMYASDELLLDEKNMQLLNAFFYENKKLPLRDNYSRDLIIKLIKTNIFSNDIYVNESDVEAKDYELLKLMKGKNSYFKVKINKEILKKCIELNINPYLISDGYDINKFIYNDDNVIDLELVNSAVKNNIVLVNNSTSNLELIKRYLEAGIDIEIPDNIYQDNLIELYNSYPNKVINDVKKDEKITDIFCEYIYNNKINKVDDEIFYFVCYAFNGNQILENIDKIKTNNKEFIYFEKYSDEKKEELIKIIEKGFPNIIKYINEEYIDEKIMDLAINNGFSDDKFIYKYFPDMLKEPKMYNYLDKIIINYGYFGYSSNYLLDLAERNKDIVYSVITKRQKKEYSNWLDYYSGFSFDYLLNKLKDDNNKIYYSNFFSNLPISRYNSQLKEKIISEFIKIYEERKIDLNLFNNSNIFHNYSEYIFTSDSNIKIAFDSGFKYIFGYIKNEDKEKWLKYATEIGYTTDVEINEYNYVKNNMHYFRDFVKINPNYINVLQSQVDIENNIDLVHQCIKKGVKLNDYIKHYLILNPQEKEYVYKLLPRMNYLLCQISLWMW